MSNNFNAEHIFFTLSNPPPPLYITETLRSIIRCFPFLSTLMLAATFFYFKHFDIRLFHLSTVKSSGKGYLSGATNV